jgi:hypothetical protein
MLTALSGEQPMGVGELAAELDLDRTAPTVAARLEDGHAPAQRWRPWDEVVLRLAASAAAKSETVRTFRQSNPGP